MNRFQVCLRALRRWHAAAATPRPRTVKLTVDLLEDRTVPSTLGPRTFDGTGNNLVNPLWGSAGTQFLRRAAAE